MIVFAWHVHHDVLVEPLTGPIEERISYIKRAKARHEIPIRLRLLKPVIGQLPSALLRSGAAYKKAVQAISSALATALAASSRTKRAAWGAECEAWAEYRTTLVNNHEEIEALHRQECPNCPWDGSTIFSPLKG